MEQKCNQAARNRPWKRRSAFAAIAALGSRSQDLTFPASTLLHLTTLVANLLTTVVIFFANGSQLHV